MPFVFFANPLILFFSMAALVPVLIHLFARRKKKLIYFSSLKLLHSSLLKAKGMLKVKQILLLILRTLLILMLVLLCARPFLKYELPFLFIKKETKAFFALVDNSASMAAIQDGVSLLQQVKEKVKNITADYNDTDIFYLMKLTAETGKPEISIFYQKNKFLKSVKNIQTSFCSINLKTCLEKAFLEMKSLDIKSKEIFLFSDNQENSWKQATAGDQNKIRTDTNQSSLPIPVYLIQYSSKNRQKSNIYIDNVETHKISAGKYIQPREIITEFKTKVHIKNHNGNKNTDVRLFIDNKLIEQKHIKLDSFSTGSLEFSYKLTNAKNYQAVVEIDDPDFLPDNQHYFIIPALYQTRALLINNKQKTGPLTESYFLEKAVSPVSKKGVLLSSISSLTINQTQLTQLDLSIYHFIYCINLNPLNEREIQILKNYVTQGGLLYWFSGNNSSQNYYRNLFTDDGFFPIGKMDRNENRTGSLSLSPRQMHPLILQLPNSIQTDLTKIKIKQAITVYESLPDTESIIKLNNDGNLVVKKNFGLGTVVFFGISADLDFSDFPLKISFLPLINELNQNLFITHRQNLYCGNMISLNHFLFKRPVNGDKHGLLVKPDRFRENFRLDTTGKIPADFIIPGFYSVILDRETGILPINLSREESRFDYVYEDELKKLLTGKLIFYLKKNDTNLQEKLADFRIGTDIYFHILIIILAIFCLESVLSQVFLMKKRKKTSND